MSLKNRISKVFFLTVISLFSILSSTFVSAKEVAKESAKDNLNTSLLKSVISQYQKSAMVQFNIEKNVKSQLLDRTNTYTGKLFLAKKLFRLEFNEPEKNQIIFDGKNLWSLQYSDAKQKNPSQVSKSIIDKKNKSQILIGIFLDPKEFFKFFEVLTYQQSGKTDIYKLSSKNVEVLNLQDIEVKILNKKTITSLSYTDDINNLTTFNFSDVLFKNSAKTDLFNFTPVKGQQVLVL